MNVYIGIDPGTKCGYAVLAEDGSRMFSGYWKLATSKKNEGYGFRYLKLERSMTELIESLRESDYIIYLGYEDVKRHLGTLAAHVYGGIVAIITKMCEQEKIEYFPLQVGTIKKTATGKGNATKEMMVAAANKEWDDEFYEDEADALWIAYTLKKEREI